MGLPPGERDHHHPDAARRRVAACGPGLRPQSGLYLLSTLQLSPIPEHPTKEQARAALDMLIDFLSEFPFVQTTGRPGSIDRSVALAGLLTAHVRGSLPTAPVILVRADTPGTGKSYLVDLFAMISTGRLCPVITASKNAEETEKRLGAVLLGGTSIVSLDNVMHDLAGELLCQLSERPVIKVRILGRSEMPECESHLPSSQPATTLLSRATWSAVASCAILKRWSSARNCASLKRTRSTTPQATAAPMSLPCSPSFGPISSRGRAAGLWPVRQLRGLVTDGTESAHMAGRARSDRDMDAAREEDEELSSIREYFDLWENYNLDFGIEYTSGRIVEAACMRMDGGGQLDLNPRTFE